MERSSGTVRTACDIQVEGKQGAREAQANMKETDRKQLLMLQLTLKKGAPRDQV